MTSPDLDAATLARLDPFLEALDDLVDQLLVGGLARAPGEVSDAARGVAERGRRLGVETPATALETLAEALEEDDEATAWRALQRVMAWSRLFRRELSLMKVAARASDEAPAESRTPDGVDVAVWPLGFELDARGGLVLFAETDSGAPARVFDHVSDFDRDAPFERPVISRLFQRRVALADVLAARLGFEGHPATEAREGLCLAPAFGAVPRLHRLADDARRGALSEVVVERGLDGARWQRDGAPLMVFETPQLELNARCLLALRGAERAPLPVCLAPGAEAARLLHAVDDLGQRVHPAQDPAAIRLPGAALDRWARELSPSLPPAVGLWLRTTTARLGGGADFAGLRDAWRAVDDLDGLWRASLALPALGARPAEGQRAAAAGWLDAALAHPAAHSVAELLQAVSLAQAFELASGREDGLRALEAARAATQLEEDDVEDLCLRVRLRALTDAELDPEGGAEGALLFLEAHLEPLRPAPGRREPRPLPEPRGLALLLETHAQLTGRLGGARLDALDLPPLPLALACADALLSARLDGHPTTADQAAWAMWIAAQGRVGRWLFA